MPRPHISEEQIEELDALTQPYFVVDVARVSTDKKLEILLKKHRELANRGEKPPMNVDVR